MKGRNVQKLSRGEFEGGEDGIADTADLEGKLTTVEQVKSFIETGINFFGTRFWECAW